MTEGSFQASIFSPPLSQFLDKNSPKANRVWAAIGGCKRRRGDGSRWGWRTTTYGGVFRVRLVPISGLGFRRGGLMMAAVAQKIGRRLGEEMTVVAR
ncbi:hypothetical protein CASFOL_034843 [Castilleja foliolosa]|uniref:Uncharacterized protein n=1 Tax=Castilleja foliolosa TaxID=1961234 RepID=A0ABD3BSJ4_9LAMI